MFQCDRRCCIKDKNDNLMQRYLISNSHFLQHLLLGSTQGIYRINIISITLTKIASTSDINLFPVLYNLSYHYSIIISSFQATVFNDQNTGAVCMAVVTYRLLELSVQSLRVISGTVNSDYASSNSFLCKATAIKAAVSCIVGTDATNHGYFYPCINGSISFVTFLYMQPNFFLVSSSSLSIGTFYFGVNATSDVWRIPFSFQLVCVS